jgi:glucose/arabinose dehydrogenase
MNKTFPAFAVAVFALAACGPSPINPKRQVGANPYLPDIHQYLLPPMHVVKNIGWGNAAPKVAPGLQITAFAKNLKNPRSLYVLPNGDVLVVESDGPPGPVSRPKELIMNWIEKQAHSSVKAGNRILLFRDTNGDGVPGQRTVFLDHLNSPFGVVLVGNDLYVGNTDGVMHYAYQEGETQITAPGNLLTPLPGGPIDHHWTKSLTASPDGTKLYAGVGSNSNITENGIGAELDRAAIWEIDRTTGATACLPRAFAIRTA